MHVKRLKEFLVDEGVDPRDIANQATNRWNVESIQGIYNLERK